MDHNAILSNHPFKKINTYQIDKPLHVNNSNDIIIQKICEIIETCVLINKTDQ